MITSYQKLAVMEIVVIGSLDRIEEFKAKHTEQTVQYLNIDEGFSQIDLTKFDVIFDLNLDEATNRFYLYKDLNVILIAGAVKTQLASYQFLFPDMQCQLFGMNTLPSFINREKVELSALDTEKKEQLNDLINFLSWDIEWVEDRVGMVTPRVIFMIINEAFYTLQEGTATKTDIDLGMRLGTNYPQGPFEWLALVGIKNVYETLLALYEDTKEERYKICPMLKTTYLKEALTA